MYTSKNIQRFPTITNEELSPSRNVRQQDQQRFGGIYRVIARNGEIAHYSTSWDLQRAKKHNLRIWTDAALFSWGPLFIHEFQG